MALTSSGQYVAPVKITKPISWDPSKVVNSPKSLAQLAGTKFGDAALRSRSSLSTPKYTFKGKPVDKISIGGGTYNILPYLEGTAVKTYDVTTTAGASAWKQASMERLVGAGYKPSDMPGGFDTSKIWIIGAIMIGAWLVFKK